MTIVWCERVRVLRWGDWELKVQYKKWYIYGKYFSYNRQPIDQSHNTQYTCSISHNTTFRTEMFRMMHWGIWNRWIVGSVRLVYCGKITSSQWRHVGFMTSQTSGNSSFGFWWDMSSIISLAADELNYICSAPCVSPCATKAEAWYHILQANDWHHFSDIRRAPDIKWVA